MKYPAITVCGMVLLMLTRGAGADDDKTAARVAKLLSSLESKDKEMRLSAAKRLGQLGSAARAAAPALGLCLRQDADPRVVQQAALALAQIGTAGVEELVTAAMERRAAVRQPALLALGKIGPEAKKAVDVLTDILGREPNGPLRAMAAFALGEIGEPAREAVPGLCQALRDAWPAVRQHAAAALGNIGRAALPAVKEAIRDTQAPVRFEGMLAMGILAYEHKEAVPYLIEGLRDPEPRIRVTAAGALGSVGPDAKDALPGLLPLLQENNYELQRTAFNAIMAIGSKDAPGFLDALAKANEEGNWAAPFVLRQFGPRAKDAVKPLIKTLEHKDDGMRLGAVLALGQVGAEAVEAVPALQKAMQDRNAQIRFGAVWSLRKIGHDWQKEAWEKLSRANLNAMQKNLQLVQLNLQAQRKGLPRGLFVPQRTVDWEALTNPLFQNQANQVVELLIIVSASRRLNILNLGKEDQAVLQKSAFEAIDNMGPEAVPALVRGIQLAYQYKLGFC